MLLPESMSRIVIVGNKSRLDDAINALYSLGAVHLIDHTNGADEGFAIGAPRPYSSKASERLLAIRSAEKDLGINPNKAEIDPISVKDIEAQISSNGVESVQTEVISAIDERNKIEQKITELKAKKDCLDLLSKLPVNLELYNGYDSIAVFAGAVKADPTEALAAVKNAETFVSFDKKTGGVVAVFIKKSEKDQASAVLSDCGYTELSVPAGTGAPAEMLATVEGELSESEKKLEDCKANIVALSEKYKSFILASDEELSITVEKGETPLRIATSEFSYVIDAWIPSKEVSTVENGLKEKLGNGVYVEVQEERGRSIHEEEKAEPRFKKAPTKMNNGPYAKRYEYPTQLISTPKYQEIDPSAIIGIFFPFFFGFMVGDVGYAIPFIVLGAYGMKVAKSKDFQAIGTVLFFGGIWAFIFGFLFFGEMLGMHFVGHATATTVTWESLLGVTLPDWFSGMLANGHGIGKLSEVTFLLKLSVYMGVVHLFVGYFVGFLNAKRMHGLKEGYLEKGGWIFTFVGMVVLCYGITMLLFTEVPEGGSIMDNLTSNVLMVMGIGAAILIVGVVSCWPKDKAMVILELPGIVGNVLSYTRLAAIGMSKAGMALAFNYIAIIMLGSSGDILGIILGSLVFLIGHLMIWVLAILSAGLHGLRLQYVELMNKFFIGGGEEYSPLKTKHKHTKIVETEV